MTTAQHLRAPILIPLPPSRSTTPASLSLDRRNHEDDISTRGRSDTLCTTSSSSSSSSPSLQTPQTPSIIGTLSQHTSYKITDLHEVPAESGGRKNTYGFGEAPLHAGPSRAESSRVASLSEISLQYHSTLNPALGNVNNIGAFFPSFTLEPEAQLAWEEEAPRLTNEDPAEDVGTSVSLNDVVDAAASQAPLTADVAIPPAFHASTGAVIQPSLGSKLRRKLEQSKSSFRALRRLSMDDADGASSSGASISVSHINSGAAKDLSNVQRRKGRLRSLLSLPRAQSSTSILSTRSFASVSSTQTSANLSQITTSVQGSTVPLPASLRDSPTVLVRDYAPASPSDYFTCDQPSTSRLQAHPEEHHDVVVLGKGKARAMSHRRATKRPSLVPITTTIPSIAPPATPPILPTPPGAIGPSSIYLQDIVLPVTLPETHEKVDLFGTRLPRELQVAVLRMLVGDWEMTGRRWDGETGGRRELIRLSRVSKYWRSLCLDGQLWSLVDLAPFASHMHSATLQRIIYHAQPFITSMSLRGMDALSGSDLIAALANLGPAEKPTTRLITYRFRLPNLVSIDLRGCKRLSSDDIVTVVLHAPKLRHVNLKGVQGVSSEVIRSLARSAKHIESLDVSRCWDLTLGDIVVFIQLLEYAQAAGIKSLRIAGLKSYGHAAADLLPLLADRLIDLKTLDLAGCSHIHSSDFERWAEVLDDAGRLSSLTHLNISHCRSLTSTTFEHLARRVPDMTRFEMAGLEAAFWTNDWDEQGLIALLRSMPRLQKLDMDAEGLHESISDRVLDVLIPGKYANKVVVGRELVELRIGYAKNVSSEAMIRLVRGCPKLKVLETDNTNANNAVMREFLRRRADADASISLVDCRTITPAAYSALAPITRTRQGWLGYAALPFGYDDGGHILSGSEEMGLGGDLAAKPVLKTFWSWRRVGPPSSWREARVRRVQEREVEGREEGGSSNEGRARRPGSGRRASWWRGDDELDERAGCVVM